MKIINLGRGQGKTTRLLYASEFQDIPILCTTVAQKGRLIMQAERLGLKIPEPIAVEEIVSNKMFVSKVADKDILIDEAPMVLQHLLHSLSMRGEIKAITLTEKE